MTAPPCDLNALLGSRICHDLISPLGAISNGLELLAMSGVVDSPEMSLISESVENANARIRFFRVAFGAANPEQEIGRAEILSILGPLSAGKLNIDWQLQNHPLRVETKLAFLLIQCLESAMPWGGTITVSQNETGWRIEGLAERLRPLPDLWSVATRHNPPNGVGANHVQFPLADKAAADLGRRVIMEEDAGAITLSF
ncbi:histidine phosphotransferase family protein [Oceaniglobus ichthyenteri]|uniref:histidine phosphotransferase family protein n=1 Tax=Oceaniglobus ichthyenteri TaxID=2136177 RepID=UPI000D3D7B81|nr:histidine phosphotransferase family protein [Oceaniglobus ichthyenteri]